MNNNILELQKIDKTQLSAMGGKCANLGELFRVEGLHVPDGFCISTAVFKRMVAGNPAVKELLHQIGLLKVDEMDKLREYGQTIRGIIEEMAIPDDIKAAVSTQLNKLGENTPCAVRSSATAEDLPAASFAGQQDTYLNITGSEAILRHVTKCWASLFTDRAITYRIRNGFDHSKVYLAVIIQQMIFPEVSGILFTADPISGNRNTVSIDAGFGLGEALVAGWTNADGYKVRNGNIIEKRIADKKTAVYALPEGGTGQRQIEPELQNRPALTDEQVGNLERTGKKIASHFGCPQDIEWCLADDRIYIVQSRPVTTLYPVPECDDGENHVYVSVGHQQMMTDAMKPLGISFWQTTTPRPMAVAGGRLFVDITPQLSSPAGRDLLVNVLGKSDPLIKDALENMLERGDFIKIQPQQASAESSPGRSVADYKTLGDYDPSVVDSLIEHGRQAIAALQQDIRARSGTALVDFILDNIQQLKQFMANPESFGVIMTGMNASSWINEKMLEWLGEKNPAGTLSQSVPSNITSEMGLALLDVADAIRPYPEVSAYLQEVKDNNFLNDMEQYNGGKEAKSAVNAFLSQYGMRCSGEIDITRPRWSEKPAILLPLITSNIKNFKPGESKRKFDQGLRQSLQKEKELLERLSALPGGEQKVKETRRMIGLLRNFAGYREYPKYHMISRYFIYKTALLKEGEQLVQDGVLSGIEDLYFLSLEELKEVIKTQKANQPLISQRKETFKIFEKLTPPRVITSEGEMINGAYKRDHLPAGAIVGLPVSAGIIEGRARVILDMKDADLGEDDILVTTFTDPSWTPLFVSIKALVTEVGGLMTHGSVIAREYGLPAVVGIKQATQLIPDGQRIRVNGTDGYVELL